MCEGVCQGVCAECEGMRVWDGVYGVGLGYEVCVYVCVCALICSFIANYKVRGICG